MPPFTPEEYAEIDRTGLYPDGTPVICPECGSDDCEECEISDIP